MIFYFSGTGNTRWAAQRLSQATGEELISIADQLRSNSHAIYKPQDGERIGFCFPTHGWQPPRIVRNFIRQATFLCNSNTYVYALTTCGDNMGHAMRILSKELRRKDICLNSAFALIMPESNVCFPFLHLDAPEREREKIEKAGETINYIAQCVVEKKQGVSKLVKGAIPYTYTYVIGGYYNRHLITDRKFWVDTDACVKCGLCAKLCPVDDIKGTPPIWQHNGNCTNCLACYHHCPKHAIHWGKMKRGQYYFKLFNNI